MFKVLKSRLSRRFGLLLVACTVLIALGYAPDASAIVRVSPRVHPYAAGYDLLSQYGDWVRIDPFGVVWCPYVDASWQPFYDGRWIWTGDGWAWDSYEPFGDLVYHYGYWYRDPNIGWFWVPGSEWSPARVEWYSYGDYSGWAPLPPPNMYWPDPWDNFTFNVWIVVPFGDFCDDHVGHHGLDRPRYRDVFRRDMVEKRAPDVHRVETVTHRQFAPERIARRPMDIRTETIKAKPRTVVERDIQARRSVPADRGVQQGGVLRPAQERQVVTPRNNPVVRPEVAVPQKRARIERQGAMPGAGAGTQQRGPTIKKSPEAQRPVLQPSETPQPGRQVAEPRQNTQVQRPVRAPRPKTPAERRAAASKQNAQPERQVSQPETRTQPAHETAAPRQNTQVERKVEPRSAGAQHAPQRAPEKQTGQTDKADKTKAKKK
jgi:hypothetical protein